MELLAQDFYFKSNSIYGAYSSESKQDAITGRYYTDLKDNDISVRIYGTQEEIDQACEDYMKGKSIYLDECYNYQVEPVGSYWYDIMLPNADEQNERVAKKLKEYNKIYKETGKPLIIGLY